MRTQLLSLTIIALVFISCQKNKYYTLEYFSKVEKIDSHYHIYTDEENSVEQAQKDNFRLLNINTFSGGCERVVEAHQSLKLIKQEHPETTEFTTTFCRTNQL